LKEAYDFIKERIYSLLELVPDDSITERYVSSAVKDWTAALVNIEHLEEFKNKGKESNNG
jgi:hypothetical protein